MFTDIMSALFDGITSLASSLFSVFSAVGAIPWIVTFSIIGLFITFVILNSHSGLLSKTGSDKVSSSRSDHVRRH